MRLEQAFSAIQQTVDGIDYAGCQLFAGSLGTVLLNLAHIIPQKVETFLLLHDSQSLCY